MASETKVPEFSYDVVIIGAGISGINAAYRIQTELPGTTYTILERRAALGGTWDLFRYPGIRSDSRLWTFGFPWRPWTEDRSIATGDAILQYMSEAAKETGIDKQIRFGHGLESADWSSATQRWRLSVSSSTPSVYNCRVLLLCTGYYDYKHPLESTIPGLKNFAGPVIHPQFWPEPKEAALEGKRVVVIGSGATAITLVPSIAEAGAARVTMLQRSPSYIVSSAAVDPVGQRLRRWFPMWLTYRLMRLRSFVVQGMFLTYCAWFPGKARDMLRKATASQLPPELPHDPHFKPAYNPWEQRLCLCPDGDFYKALRAGKANVVTDTIKNVASDRIELTSGHELEADLVITATGLKLQFGGGATLSVDGTVVDFGDKFAWKSAMLQDVPNMVMPFGYANASWTLGADCAAWLAIRLIKYMDRYGYGSATPRMKEVGNMQVSNMLQLTSTYVSRGRQSMPKSGSRAPWQPRSSYMWDLWDAKSGSLATCMEYQKSAS